MIEQNQIFWLHFKISRKFFEYSIPAPAVEMPVWCWPIPCLVLSSPPVPRGTSTTAPRCRLGPARLSYWSSHREAKLSFWTDMLICKKAHIRRKKNSIVSSILYDDRTYGTSISHLHNHILAQCVDPREWTASTVLRPVILAAVPAEYEEFAIFIYFFKC